MKHTVFGMAALAASVILFSCFSITVNVYFPEKDVKSAFKSLEKDLMKGGEGTAPTETPDAVPPKNDEAPAKPQSRIELRFGPTEAFAQGAGELSSELAAKLRDDPDVVKAYREMGERLGFINRLRDQGLVGEGKDGSLVPKGELDKRQSAAVREENDNRATVIRAMAKAIVEINKQPVNDSSIGQVLDKAASQFASVRRESAKPGWWVQGEGGGWTKK